MRSAQRRPSIRLPRQGPGYQSENPFFSFIPHLFPLFVTVNLYQMNNSCAALLRHHFLSQVRHQNDPSTPTSRRTSTMEGARRDVKKKKSQPEFTAVHWMLYLCKCLWMFLVFDVRDIDDDLGDGGAVTHRLSKVQVFPERMRHLVVTKYCRAPS